MQLTNQELELWYFQTSGEAVKSAVGAGISTFIVDWENKSKAARQWGRDTEINYDTVEDLERVAAVHGVKAVCRINRLSSQTARDIDTALSGGAKLILLPMVEQLSEAETFLRLLNGRAAGGILIETANAVSSVKQLAKLPLSAVYIGLNDLCISLGKSHIFEAVVDGTVEHVCTVLADEGLFFGMGGVTVVDGGAPVPCRLLMAELCRLDVRFTFLRRSFRRDIAGRDIAIEVTRIQSEWRDLRARDRDQVESDHRSMLRVVGGLSSQLGAVS